MDILKRNGAKDNSSPTESEIMTYKIINDDCINAMKQMKDNSVDSIVTDAPYGLSSEPDIEEVLSKWLSNEEYSHNSSGFMGARWDSFVPGPRYWKEAFRVLKPGGYLLCFSGTRTVDLMGISIRLGGFEIKDSIHFIFGSGFPKSRDISVDVDKKLGKNRKVVGTVNVPGFAKTNVEMGAQNRSKYEFSVKSKEPITNEAKKLFGFGTALKPSHEIIIVARKPLSEKTIADNVLKWGTGAINIDGTRVTTNDNLNGGAYAENGSERDDGWGMQRGGAGEYKQPTGRWPPNTLLQHSEGCNKIGFKKVKGHKGYKTGPGGSSVQFSQKGTKTNRTEPWFGYSDEEGNETVEKWDCTIDCPISIMNEQSGNVKTRQSKPSFGNNGKIFNGSFQTNRGVRGYNEEGGSSRFFPNFEYEPPFMYVSKPSQKERNAGVTSDVVHPTQKPIKLMRWLMRLVTPPVGTAVDIFCGSGSSGCAAVLERLNFIGIEKDKDYAELARQRISYWESTLPKTKQKTLEEL